MITVMLNEAIQILKANAKILVTSTDVFPSHAGDAILSFLFCKSSLPHLLLFSFSIHYMDFPDCLLLLLSISVFLLFSFSVFTLFSCRFRAVD